MNTISITQLKTSPSKIMYKADEYPVRVVSRNKTRGYLLGKELFEKIYTYLENHLDVMVVKEANFKKGRSFEEIADELGI